MPLYMCKWIFNNPNLCKVTEDRKTLLKLIIKNFVVSETTRTYKLI